MLQIYGNGSKLDLGGEHTIEYIDTVLWCCTLEILLTSVTSIYLDEWI